MLTPHRDALAACVVRKCSSALSGKSSEGAHAPEYANACGWVWASSRQDSQVEHAAKLKAARDALDGAETTAKLAANVRSAGYAPAVQLPLPVLRPPIVI